MSLKTPTTIISFSEWAHYQCKFLTGCEAVGLKLLVTFSDTNKRQYLLRTDGRDETKQIKVPVDKVMDSLKDPNLFDLGFPFILKTSQHIYVDIPNQTALWKPDPLKFWASELRNSVSPSGFSSDYLRSNSPKRSEADYQFNLKQAFFQVLRSRSRADKFTKAILHYALPQPLEQHLVYIVDSTMFFHHLTNVDLFEPLEDTPFKIQKFWKGINESSLARYIKTDYRYLTLLGENDVWMYNFETAKVSYIENLNVLTDNNDRWVLMTAWHLNHIISRGNENA